MVLTTYYAYNKMTEIVMIANFNYYRRLQKPLKLKLYFFLILLFGILVLLNHSYENVDDSLKFVLGVQSPLPPPPPPGYGSD